MTWARDTRCIPRAFVYALTRDAATRRNLGAWLRSLRRSCNLLAEGRPWMPFATVEWLDRTLRADMRVFEWGSGGSTVYLASKVRHVVSVEHDPAWHGRVSTEIARRGIANVRCVLAPAPPAERAAADSDSVASAGWHAGLDFSDYVAEIDAYPAQHFDLVVVDGRQRTACARRAIAKIREGGHLLLDDSKRDRYAELRHGLKGRPAIDFRGLTPQSGRVLNSTAWRITCSRDPQARRVLPPGGAG